MRAGAAVVRDWDDYLSPIVIKELRQDLRGGFFLPLLFLQLGLVVLTLMELCDQNADWSGIFEGGLAGIFIAFLPLSSLFALSQETKENTLELLLLSRMTVWRLVVGKWLARVVVSFLLATTILPFLVLGYLIGGQDVVSELEYIAYLFVQSSVFLALTISISALGASSIRVICYMLLLSCFMSSLIAPDYYDWFWELLLLGSLPILFDVVAAAQGTVQENRTWRRRLLGLAFLAGTIYLMARERNDNEIIAIGLLLVFFYYDLAQLSLPKPRHLVIFKRLGSFGQISSIFLLPGWPSAFMFYCVPLALILLAVRSYSVFLAIFFEMTLCSISAGLILLISFGKQMKSPAFFLFFLSVGFSLIGVLVILLMEVTLRIESGMPLTTTWRGILPDQHNIVNFFNCLLLGFICLLSALSLPWYRKVRQIRKEALS